MTATLRATSLLLTLTLAHHAFAQCTPQWQSGDPLPYVRGTVNATVTWDSDGTGPAPLQLVVGGNFAAGAMGSTAIAAFDGSQWTPLGTPPGPVTELVDWNGQLVASVSLPSYDVIVRWDGTAWQDLGFTVGYVHALSVFQGELVAGGSFASILIATSWLTTNNIARWNGSAWSTLGAGIHGDVRAMTVFNNLLLVGGALSYAGGVPAGNLGAWNGSSWLATATFNGPIECFAVRTGITIGSGQLFVGGSFTTCGAAAAQFVARYTNSTSVWSGVAGGLPAPCSALFANDGLLFGTEVVAAFEDFQSSQRAWRWNGSAWTSLGNVIDTNGNFTPSGLLMFGGQYVLSAQLGDQAVRRFDGVVGWPALQGAGLSDWLLAVDAAGPDIVIGGTFASISGVQMNSIARGTHGNWQPLGSGIEPLYSVAAITRTSNGDVIAGGYFPRAGGVIASNIARWNGSAWSPLGSGLNGAVGALLRLANGDIVATGAFTVAGGVAANRVARWNGTTWSALGNGLDAPAVAAVQLANGDLVVGGDFLVAGGVATNRIARWNGTAWSALGAGFDGVVKALAVRPNGTLAAGGAFLNAGAVSAPYVALWNGIAWSSPSLAAFRPNATVNSLTALPDGDLVAGGVTFYYSNPIVRTNLERWNGSVWSSLDTRGNYVNATTLAPDGHVIAVGEFALAGGVPSGNVAHLVTPCPAQVTAFGPGCTGSGGPNVLTAQSLPWTGNAFRGRATGMPALGFAIAVTGFLPTSLPIASVLPEGLPGCTLLVTPDLLDPVVPVAGVAQSTLAVPDTVSLAGIVLYHQIASFATNVAGSVVAITATNGLVATVGTL